MQRGIDLKKIAEQMTGSSGAELKAVCTEAGMFALRERRVHVTQVRQWGGGWGGWPSGMERGAGASREMLHCWPTVTTAS